MGDDEKNRDPTRLKTNKNCTIDPAVRDTGMIPNSIILSIRSGVALAYTASIAIVTPLRPKHEPAGLNKRKSKFPKTPPPRSNGHITNGVRFLDDEDVVTIIEDMAGDRFKKTKMLTSKCRNDVCEIVDKTNDKP